MIPEAHFSKQLGMKTRTINPTRFAFMAGIKHGTLREAMNRQFSSECGNAGSKDATSDFIGQPILVKRHTITLSTWHGTVV